MANTLTDLAADIYKAADKVGRERVGFIPSITVNADSSMAVAKGDVVRSHFTRSVSVSSSYAPSMTIPEGTDQTVDNKTLTLDQYATVQIPWTGEDMKHVNNGSGFSTIMGDQISQAMRAIANTIEAHVWAVAYQGASRAVGTAGTTPFASNLDAIADVREILAYNGCPMTDGMLSLVLSGTASTKMRKLSQLQKVNESGDTSFLRQGVLLDIMGIMMKESHQITTHTKGAGTGYDFVGAGEAIGQTTLSLEGGTVNSTGFKAGDVITHAGDATNKYVVNTGLTATSGDIVIGSPGLLVAGVDANEITIGNTYTPNVLLHKSAVELICRPVAEPSGGDAATDRMVVQDPVSGLVFTISIYKGYKKSMTEVSCLYQAKAWKSDNIAILMG